MAGPGQWFPNGSPGGGGSGDVTGPASSTDNAAARFDGVGGKTIQDSAVILTDTGGVEAATYAFTGGTNYFFSFSSSVVRLTVNGTERFRFDTNSSGRFYVAGDSFPGMVGLTKGATVVNVGPDIALDADTGVGSAGANQLSLVAGGSEVARFVLATNPYAMLRAHDGAVADGSVPTSFVAVYLNEAGNLLTFKVKYSDGTTVKTGVVALV